VKISISSSCTVLTRRTWQGRKERGTPTSACRTRGIARTHATRDGQGSRSPSSEAVIRSSPSWFFWAALKPPYSECWTPPVWCRLRDEN